MMSAILFSQQLLRYLLSYCKSLKFCAMASTRLFLHVSCYAAAVLQENVAMFWLMWIDDWLPWLMEVTDDLKWLWTRGIYKFRIFEFFIFKCSDIAYFDPKLPFLWLKFLKNYIYIQITSWNNANSRRLGLKRSKFHFLPFLEVQKFIAYTNIQIHVTCSIFIIFFF